MTDRERGAAPAATMPTAPTVAFGVAVGDTRRLALRGDRGAAGLEALAFGLLIFVVGTVLVLGAWRVVDAKFAAASAAREATRTFVEHPAPGGGGARTAAVAAADAALGAYGMPEGTERTVTIDGALVRCARVSTTVQLQVPALVLPWIDGLAATTVRADHAELVDPLRAGLDGEAGCVAG